ncbi:C3HC zinc finger-like-domain-containing protein [Xylogone sp. PMI_703]|nr:C3HC zinc finger-like-domain-containing protein [Xylogone sp. PMI_703]
MNSSKRKFNALLHGLGSRPSSPRSTNNVNNSAPNSPSRNSVTKRVRTSLDSTPSQPLQQTSKTVAPYKAAGSQEVASEKTEASGSATPKYAPWDREAFLKRLKTFASLTDWTPKPARVDEVQWAKRGWVCKGKERVRCSLCNVEILVKLNRREVDGKEEPVYIPENIEEALVSKYEELIVASHNEDCLWRKRGCDDLIFKLPLNTATTAIQNLRERYNELYSRRDNLPPMENLRLPSDLDLNLIIKYLPKDFLNPTGSDGSTENTQQPAPEINRVALTMALFGWQEYAHNRLGPQLGSASCHSCFRVLGLWLFKSKDTDTAAEKNTGPVINCLDVIKEHRNYCPWSNSVSQNGPKSTGSTATSSLAGWETLLRVLKNDYHLRESGSGHARKESTLTNNTDSTFDADIDDDEARSIREEKDKERWARLRRVKTFFDTKGSKRLSKQASDLKSGPLG